MLKLFTKLFTFISKQIYQCLMLWQVILGAVNKEIKAMLDGLIAKFIFRLHGYKVMQESNHNTYQLTIISVIQFSKIINDF